MNDFGLKVFKSPDFITVDQQQAQTNWYKLLKTSVLIGYE